MIDTWRNSFLENQKCYLDFGTTEGGMAFNMECLILNKVAVYTYEVHRQYELE